MGKVGQKIVLWTEDETAKLRETYPHGIAKSAAVLPGRSLTSIFQRAFKLGLKRLRFWTPEEDERLRFLWGMTLFADICREMGRTQAGVHFRAQKLGLPPGCPEGWEYLTHAAKRTGYDVATLRKVLRDSGVRIAESYTYRKRVTKRKQWIVESANVAYAISRRNDTETVFDAACRRGMCAETLRAWLKTTNLPRPTKASAVWRVPSEEIDRVIKERTDLLAQGEPLGAIAWREGIRRETLSRWLRKHKVEFRRGWVRTIDAERVIMAERRRPDCRAFKRELKPLKNAPWVRVGTPVVPEQRSA